ANSLPPVVPQNGPFTGQHIPVRLSRVRVLDILLWAEVAIYGRNPHPAWLAAHRAAFNDPASTAQMLPLPPLPARPVRREPILPEVEGVDVFKDDNAGYLQWVRKHSNGLVLNCDRSPRAT